MMHKNTKGFTLIELLIVIAIIGILSSVVLSSLNSARKKAQNAKRITQLVQIGKALEMYYNDHGEYPIGHTTSYYRRDCDGSTTPNDPNGIIPGLVPAYIPQITSDPAMDSVRYFGCLQYGSAGENYSLTLAEIPGNTNADYAVYPAFIPPYHDGGGDRCARDGTTYDEWGVWSEGACENTDAGAQDW